MARAHPHWFWRNRINYIRPWVVRFRSWERIRWLRVRVRFRGFGFVLGSRHAFSIAAFVPSFQFHHFSSSGSCLDSRSEEHTSELQSLRHLVCRLLLEKKKTQH